MALRQGCWRNGQVNIYWHVIQSGPGYNQGALSSDAINNQIAVLNQKFRKANVHFNVSVPPCGSAPFRT